MKVLWTNYAKTSLKDIHNYYSLYISKTIARNIKNGILSSVKALSKNPHIGLRESKLSSLNFDYRFVISGNYKITYRIISDIILIIDVFDTRQSPLKIKH